MGFVYYITLFVSIEDWVGLWSSDGSFHAVAFSFLAIYSLFSFFVCVLTDPGHVPPSYVPDVEDRELSDQEFRRNVSSIVFACVLYLVRFQCANWSGRLAF